MGPGVVSLPGKPCPKPPGLMPQEPDHVGLYDTGPAVDHLESPVGSVESGLNAPDHLAGRFLPVLAAVRYVDDEQRAAEVLPQLCTTLDAGFSDQAGHTAMMTFYRINNRESGQAS